ncbi:aspartic proteinase precursor [Phyllosticta citriasiana]|uniref:aspartic proteinase precursor n=1 Tax=Phyllosticta citriasiana TaxID=595635 RepID=UPI0030FDCF94
MATKGLSRVVLNRNANYKASGPNPTKEGPYFVSNRIETQGKFGTTKAIGGQARVRQHVLQKRLDDSGKSGEVPSEDIQYDAMYLSTIGIGTPAQNVALDFDTGSADLWVWSTELPASVQSSGKHNIYDPSKSSTYKKLDGCTWKIQYGDSSSASGDVGTDNVDLGGLTIKDQPKAVPTPVENLIAQQDIPKDSELFTAYLGSWRDTNEADKGESFYTFGYIDQDTLKAANTTEPHYVDVDSSQGFWQFESTSATVNGKTVTRSGNTAIADTGTTLDLIDDSTLEQIYAAIPGSKYDTTQRGYVYPSDTSVDKLPVVTFAVGDKQFTIQKEDLGFADAGNGYIYGGIQSRGSLDFDILGDTFLKGIYAIFDQGNKRFGAVQRIEKDQNTDVPPSS